jgi:hypothetical protein
MLIRKLVDYLLRVRQRDGHSDILKVYYNNIFELNIICYCLIFCFIRLEHNYMKFKDIILHSNIVFLDSTILYIWLRLYVGKQNNFISV